MTRSRCGVHDQEAHFLRVTNLPTVEDVSTSVHYVTCISTSNGRSARPVGVVIGAGADVGEHVPDVATRFLNSFIKVGKKYISHPDATNNLITWGITVDVTECETNTLKGTCPLQRHASEFRVLPDGFPEHVFDNRLGLVERDQLGAIHTLTFDVEMFGQNQVHAVGVSPKLHALPGTKSLVECGSVIDSSSVLGAEFFWPHVL
ncbi:hypothetical protein D3C79_787730 [compost metagenome]